MKNFIRVSLCLVIALLGCKEAILHDLTESDANRLLAKLHQRAISAEKIRQADGRWTLTVQGHDTLQAVTFLNDARLIRSSGVDLSDHGSLTASREEQRFRFERAMSSEIERTLQSLSGVLEARVHLNLPLTDPLFGQPLKGEPGSASVLLVTDSHFSAKTTELQALVAGASGVAAERVSVVFSQEALIREGGEGGAPVVEPIAEIQTVAMISKNVELPSSPSESSTPTVEVPTPQRGSNEWISQPLIVEAIAGACVLGGFLVLVLKRRRRSFLSLV